MSGMKRIFVDYTRLGKPEKVTQFRTRLYGRERDGLEPGVPVIAEGDTIPDREAYFVEFLDEHLALFSFEPPASVGSHAAAKERPAR